jgi:hypothetical protein
LAWNATLVVPAGLTVLNVLVRSAVAPVASATVAVIVYVCP